MRVPDEMSKGLLETLKGIIIDWLARRLPDCKRMTRRLGESLDRQPRWSDSVMMKLHLLTCEACERYLEQITFLKKAVHAHCESPPECSDDKSTRLSAESKDRLREILRGTAG